jgi:hypothetical protein
LRSPGHDGGTTTTRSTPASVISGTSFSMVKGSGSCGVMPGTHFQSGVSAFHRWIWASTISRLRAGWAAGACADPGCAPCAASAAPAPSVVLMKPRRDNMDEPSPGQRLNF